VLESTERVRALITGRKDSAEILKVAQSEGLTTLRQCAVRKLKAGVTTFEEVARVTAGD
jgi:type II secretory ATPase GspE/PulE/Tfp pilus assembly ATPase PilB-like protein